MNLQHDLLCPEAYPGLPLSKVELVRTHISWVFLRDGDVFKVKRPVAFGFLDFSTVDKRKAACEAELRLNTRLAPGIYLGVVPVTLEEDGQVRVGGKSGRIVDWAVHMRRLPDARRADLRLSRGELSVEMIDAIATAIARFHAGAAVDDANAHFGSARAVSSCVEENFQETAATIERYLSRDEADELTRWQRAFLRDRSELFERRLAERRVRDGHGDLRLEHVYVGDDLSLAVIDCIEFSDRFRYGDVCSDIAFLSMDLVAHGHVSGAERLLSRYARAANDYDLYALVDFYESYRAFVRGKISALVDNDPSIDPAMRKQARDDARRYFLLALSTHRRSVVGPSVVAVGGGIAAGKSTIAEAVGDEMNAPIVDTDRTRKAMLGVAVEHPVRERAWQGAYDARVSEDVYKEVLRRAGIVLDSGRSVVVDASFRSAAFRGAVRDLAKARGIPFLFVECRIDPQIAKRRLEERSRAPSISDGRVAIFDDFSAGFEAVVGTEFPEGSRIVVDTGRDLCVTLAELRQRLNVWPEGFSS